MNLRIPDITPEHDTLSAALAYARAGWYVLPVSPATKHAGSVLGKGWPAKTSRDPETIIAWFAGTSHALALHVGRSGAVCFDIDRPANMPPELRAALHATPPPFQSTRTADPERGHYLYTVPPGRSLSNSTGRLGREWGEVRGRNGIIVVTPSQHAKAAEGGRYMWVRTGTLPELPPTLAALLPDAATAEDAATDTEVVEFLRTHTTGTRPELLRHPIAQFAEAVARGESRHQAAVAATAWAMREAAAGIYPAAEAARALQEAFVSAMGTSRDGVERALPPDQAKAEYAGILAWAISQTATADKDKVRAEIEARVPADPFAGLIPPSPTNTTENANIGHAAETAALCELLGETPPAGGREEDQVRERTSWWPRDLAGILAGVEEEPPPAYLAREDGARLFYAGKVNALLGESESGKTWVALLAVSQALASGDRVVYLDFEDTPTGIVGRLRALGVPDDAILGRLYYVGPDETLRGQAAEDLRELLEAVRPGLVVLDGWNAAMTLLELDLNSNTDATQFSQRLLKPLTVGGACVVAIDHVPKHKENRGKGGIGAQAKRAMLTGSAIIVEVVEPFGRGMTGRLRLFVDKDRAGHVRAVSGEAKYAGTAVLSSDAATGNVTVSIRAPETQQARVEIEDFTHAQIMEEISNFLSGSPARTSLSAIRRAIRRRGEDVDAALEELVRRGYVARQARGSGYVHVLVRPYSVAGSLVSPDPEVSDLPLSGGFSGTPSTEGDLPDSPLSVPSGQGGHGPQNQGDLSDLPLSVLSRTGSGQGSAPPENPVPSLYIGTGQGFEGGAPTPPWIKINTGEWLNPHTGEITPNPPTTATGET